MLPKPPACSSCALVNIGKGYCPDKEVASPLYVFIGEAPGKNELVKGEPFVGDAGYVLHNWGIVAVPEIRLAWEAGRIWLGNTIRCLYPKAKVTDRPYPTGTEQDSAEECCGQYDGWAVPSRPSDKSCPEPPNTQQQAIKAVVLFGEVPQRLWFGAELEDEDDTDRRAGRRPKGVLRRVGRVRVRYGWRFVFAPHPAWVMREPSLYEHLEKALTIASGREASQPIQHVPWEAALQLAAEAPEVGLDLEWNPEHITVYGVAWANGTEASATYANDVTARQFQTLLNRWAARGTLVTGHNVCGGKSDIYRLRTAGFDICKLHWFDTHLGLHATHSHLAGTARKDEGEDKGAIGSFDARSMSLLYGGYKGKRIPVDWKAYDTDLLATCREDAAVALWCAQPMRERIRLLGLEPLVGIHHRAAAVFAAMEEQGVRFNLDTLAQVHRERQQRVVELVAKHELTEQRGKKVIKTVEIWRSPKVLEMFASRYGRKPANRQYETWETLAQDEDLSPDGREFAQALMLLSEGANDAHWLGKIEELEDGSLTFGKIGLDGMAYPRWRLTGTADRSVSRGPNMKNFPRPKDDPRTTKLRSTVIPLQADHALITADFDSLESYTTAIMCGDWDKVEAIKDDRVSHENTAKFVNDTFGLNLSRQGGKTINHAVDKGMSEFELARQLLGKTARKDVDLARRVIDLLLNQWPKTRDFRQKLWDDCKRNPYVAINPFGRRLLIFGRASYGEDTGYGKKSEALIRDRWKKALAFLSRSAGYDVLLRAMLRIHEERRLGDFSLPYLEVSDELDFSVTYNKILEYSSAIKQAFEEPVAEMGGFSFPAAVQSGRTWADAK